MMRWFVLLCVLLGVTACTTKRKVVVERTYAHRVDTTRQRKDSVSVQEVYRERVSEVVQTEDSSYFGFVEGGGVVQIDSGGRVTMRGVAWVRSNKHHIRERGQEVDKAVVHDSVSIAVNNGVTDSVAVVRQVEVEREGALVRWKPPNAVVFLLLGMIAMILILINYYRKRR